MPIRACCASPHRSDMDTAASRSAGMREDASADGSRDPSSGDRRLPFAVIGAGPVGLAAAARLAGRGEPALGADAAEALRA